MLCVEIELSLIVIGVLTTFVATPITVVVKASVGFCAPKEVDALVVAIKTMSKDATMEEFSILNCEILWNKKNKISKSHKTALKENLKTMSAKIQNAMKFTSDNEQSIVTYPLSPEIKNQECEELYILEVYVAGCEENQKFWHAGIRSGSKASDDSYIADIYNEKFRVYTGLLEKEVQPDSFNK